MKPRRIAFVTRAVLGHVRTGGAGTATTFLALALARLSHPVSVFYVGDPPTDTMDAEWARLYAEAGISIHIVRVDANSVEPNRFARMSAVEAALREDPPDVVIAHELTAPAYTCLRLRQLGLGFQRTLFVVFCHGTRLWAKEVARNERVSADVLVEAALERASVELADVVVSPSAYLVSWMQDQGWRLPERTFVIPYVTRSAATGEPLHTVPVRADGRVQRLVFFGRLEERKGLRSFLAGVSSLEPGLLADVELEFIGRATPEWPPARVVALLSKTARHALRGVAFDTQLDQHEALARLSRPGTLAVMPSLGDNSPNTVYECLERGIPFIASSAGGIPELVAPEDRPHVLFEPTAEGVAAALRHALSAEDAPHLPRPAFDDAASLQQWEGVITTSPRPVPHLRERPPVDAVVVHRLSREALARCLSALAAQNYAELRITVADASGAELGSRDLAGQPLVVHSEGRSVEAARQVGLQAGNAPWILVLDEEDVAAPELLETLVRAQAASGADVVTCGLHVRHADGRAATHFFLGEPRALGLLANGYGSTCLIRRSLLRDGPFPWRTPGDPDWPLLAGLTAAGARIVSVPRPLVTRSIRPGTLGQHPSDALLVVQELEQRLPRKVRSLARLAAGLAADMEQELGRHGS